MLLAIKYDRHRRWAWTRQFTIKATESFDLLSANQNPVYFQPHCCRNDRYNAGWRGSYAWMTEAEMRLSRILCPDFCIIEDLWSSLVHLVYLFWHWRLRVNCVSLCPQITVPAGWQTESRHPRWCTASSRTINGVTHYCKKPTSDFSQIGTKVFLVYLLFSGSRRQGYCPYWPERVEDLDSC